MYINLSDDNLLDVLDKHESLLELQTLLEENYFEHLIDKKENPQDYE